MKKVVKKLLRVCKKAVKISPFTENFPPIHQTINEPLIRSAIFSISGSQGFRVFGFYMAQNLISLRKRT